jgi:class 3 adenylate cyclase
VERKLATVLFVDLVSSTSFVSGSDPEVVRRRVSQFFEQVSRCIVTHGGIVEKFAGDAVMAAFGVPLAHEDDAERAIRAGLATLERVRDLGLQARIGIESGEVVTEDDAESTFATGEAVNLAARLQQEAEAGEIIVGPGAARLVRGRIELDEVGPLELRGWQKPVTAYRVVCASEPGAPVGGISSPLVGRESELELLENTFARTVRDRRASLFTLYGDPGVGKSRLAREFVAGLEGATVLMGRCLPYGEGVTYWPLAEMVKASAGIADDDPLDEAQRKLRACCEDEAVADLLGLAVGVLEAVEGERSRSCSCSRTCTGARSRCSSSSSIWRPPSGKRRCSCSVSHAASCSTSVPGGAAAACARPRSSSSRCRRRRARSSCVRSASTWSCR